MYPLSGLSFVYSLKTQMNNQDCDGGKISKDDKKTSALSSKEKLTEAQSVVNPIASKAPATYDWQS
ncbi:hypothetical protein JOM56_005851 [Amanita muscaria]